MLITTQQALAQYHLAYDNIAYKTACGAIGWLLLAGTSQTLTSVTDSPAYIELANLLTDSALEMCGHPAYHGRGWTLAFKLHQLGAERLERGVLDFASLQRTFTTVETYLARFRQQIMATETLLHNDPTASGLFQMEGALVLLADSVCTTSTISNRSGRAAYHLTAACVGMLRTAALILKNSHSPDAYAAEKFSRSLRDLLYGLNELADYPYLPRIFRTLREHLLKCVEEG
jgi:hypothetical protein